MARTLTVNISSRSIVLAIALVIGVYAIARIPDILILGAMALVVAAAMWPGVKRLESWHLPRWAAVSLMFAMLLGTLALLGALVVPSLIDQGTALLRDLPHYSQQVEASYGWVQELQRQFPFLPEIDEVGAQVSSAATGWLASSVEWVATVIGAGLDLMVVLVVAFFVLLEGAKLKSGLLSLVPPVRREELGAQFEPVAHKLGAYVNGILISMAFLATVLAIALTVAGVPLALAIAIMAGVLEIIPIVGPLLAIAPAVVLAMTVSWQLALVTLGIFAVAQFLQGNFVTPLVFSKSVELSPVVVTFALLIGHKLWGIPGAIIAVPLVAAVQVLVQNLYVAPMESRSRITATPLLPEAAAGHEEVSRST